MVPWGKIGSFCWSNEGRKVCVCVYDLMIESMDLKESKDKEAVKIKMSIIKASI